ncbi:hypothetical protein C1645_813137 [Glomus cerebriforme]|uniref:Uncharacterized protein n=1 Tax=Glomus cerebriforme TaxID=658196 RepID=A0A397TME9_9GLOM|nr:hypothetical protein C1645_813137 [Glomus cerebriforme]
MGSHWAKSSTVNIDTQIKEYAGIFRKDAGIIKSTKSQQQTLQSSLRAADSRKIVIEDMVEAFLSADIPLQKIDQLLPFFKKYLKEGGAISKAPTLRQIYLPSVFEKHVTSLKLLFDSMPPVMPQLIHVPCCVHILNLIGETWRDLPQFNILKRFLQDIKDVFVNTPARRRRFFEAELQDNIRNEKLAKIQSILQNVREKRIITIYIHFISNFSKEFVHTLNFFQQKNTPVFPFIELQLQQLNSYLESNRILSDFGSSLEHLISTLYFNPVDFYPIFEAAFEAAFAKFSLHIPNHPAQELFKACQIFDPAYFFYSDVGRKNIRLYSIINGFDNSSNKLLREWSIYYDQQ